MKPLLHLLIEEKNIRAIITLRISLERLNPTKIFSEILPKAMKCCA